VRARYFGSEIVRQRAGEATTRPDQAHRKFRRVGLVPEDYLGGNCQPADRRFGLDGETCDELTGPLPACQKPWALKDRLEKLL
jgi:hypothetical protein